MEYGLRHAHAGRVFFLWGVECVFSLCRIDIACFLLSWARDLAGGAVMRSNRGTRLVTEKGGINRFDRPNSIIYSLSPQNPISASRLKCGWIAGCADDFHC